MNPYRIQPGTSEQDYQDVCRFLRDQRTLSEEKSRYWAVGRLDYMRWHLYLNVYETDIIPNIHLAKDANGALVAVFLPDCPVGYHLQTDPILINTDSIRSLLDYARESLGKFPPNGARELHIPAESENAFWETLMAESGFKKSRWTEHRHVGELPTRPESYTIPEGFTLRNMLGQSDFPSRSWASWRAFHPNDPDSSYEGWEWYGNVVSSPLYRNDLDVVAVDKEGEIAGFCTGWYDAQTQSCHIDPVGLKPEYHRLGLGRCMLLELFRRLEGLGVRTVSIDSYEKPATGLYEKVGLKVETRWITWTWDGTRG